jgi:hypothetical protein
VAFVRLRVDGQLVAAAAFDHDTVSASLKAVLAALDRTVDRSVGRSMDCGASEAA